MNKAELEKDDLKKELRAIFEADYPGINVFAEKVLDRVFGKDAFQKNPAFENIGPDDDACIVSAYHCGVINGVVPIYVYDVTLKDSSNISRSRVGIQRYVRSHLTIYRQAFILFHYANPENRSWRFSYLYKNSSQADSTIAKRYTYLFSRNQFARTASERFAELACKKITGEEQLIEAFSVENLSDEFFDEYREHYADFVQYVTGKRYVKTGNKWVETKIHEPKEDFYNAFGRDDKRVRDYVKKMMGRLVFLCFLQRKGWLGNGDSKYLFNLYHNAAPDVKADFLDRVLEPMFFGLLNTRPADRAKMFADNGWDISLITGADSIPYLNGGLFECDSNDVVNSDFPCELFSNPAKPDDPKNYHGRGFDYNQYRGLLDFLTAYNFTIDENDPDDAEIGVDPEMLGRIFENLLEDNKDKGAYYTPKEIVQYMCRESLIAYLTTCFMERNDRFTRDKVEAEVRKLVMDPESKVPGMGTQAKVDFGNDLRKVKICDPAIGSGAFPMGLLNQLVRCRVSIDAWAKDATGRLLIGDYAALKREIINNNIYGVDIERGAIDIARLRFWLSIVVDEQEPQPLPNLDYKFMQGNSLITTFNGEYINLDTKEQKHVKVAAMKAEKENLYELKQKYYSATGDAKYQLDIQIKDSILNLIYLQLDYEKDTWKNNRSEQLALFPESGPKQLTFADMKELLPEDKQTVMDLGAELRSRLYDDTISLYARAQTDIRFFDWRIMFTEVFEGKNPGFDIVIGNPPYFVYEGHNKGEIAILKKIKDFNIAKGGKLNAYKLFLAHALKCLVKTTGINCFIFQNSFMADLQAANLRKYTLSNCQIISIDSFPERDNKQKRVFESVKMSVCIVLIHNVKGSDPFVVNIWDDKNKTTGTITSFSKAEIEAIDKNGYSIPRISEEVKPIVIKMLKHKDIKIKCNEGELNVTSHRDYFSVDDSLPAIMKGAGIQRYYYTYDMSQGSIEFLKEDEYLADYGSSEKSQHHLERRIVMQGMTGANDRVRLVMTIIPKGLYLGHSCKYIMPIKELSLECILAVLNSKIANLFFRCFSTNSNINGYEIENIPIPNIPSVLQEELSNKVSSILSLKEQDNLSDTSLIEREIDKIVYELYGLSDKEIQIVEKSYDRK